MIVKTVKTVKMVKVDPEVRAANREKRAEDMFG